MYQKFFGYSDIDVRHYEQKIRNLEYENQELRSETVQLKIDSENYEHQEQSIVDNFVNALGKIIPINIKEKKNIFIFYFKANANAEIDNLQQELIKKTDENTKQHDEILRLSYDVKTHLFLKSFLF